ncbi:hypothetical protein GXP67_16135 [Rhodocytophaga rosea]|uniref:Uncharacterized protein n=1 Tax=Rhodocytophaga rosea TaxID=2704465 RepID=A0A6C0GJC7_9BACT|nr:hypothetical protein [Rhodocytophaga rosea]QHT68059.1 hypothetical protein GXP67_16135 [Rhodocytophaga rosea]
MEKNILSMVSISNKSGGVWQGYIDGKAKEADMFIRLYTLVNINSHMILWYFQKGDNQEKFTDEANVVAGSVKLLEFGY